MCPFPFSPIPRISLRVPLFLGSSTGRGWAGDFLLLRGSIPPINTMPSAHPFVGLESHYLFPTPGSCLLKQLSLTIESGFWQENLLSTAAELNIYNHLTHKPSLAPYCLPLWVIPDYSQPSKHTHFGGGPLVWNALLLLSYSVLSFLFPLVFQNSRGSTGFYLWIRGFHIAPYNYRPQMIPWWINDSEGQHFL